MDSEGRISLEAVRNEDPPPETAAVAIRADRYMVWDDDVGYSAWMVTKMLFCGQGIHANGCWRGRRSAHITWHYDNPLNGSTLKKFRIEITK